MKHLFKSYILLIGLAMMASCSDDKWEPGAPNAENMGVYFDKQSAYTYMIEPDDSHLINLTFRRADSSMEAIVPLQTISCPEGVVLPQSVTFAAGSATAVAVADLTNMPTKTSGTIEIKIDPAYSTVYAAGTSTLALNITMSGGWIDIAPDVTLSYYDNNFPSQSTKIQQLDGTNRFKLCNFMNSGLDVYFTVDGDTAEYAEFLPYKNSISYEELYGEDEYGMWCFYDTDKEELPQWVPSGNGPDITLAAFYGGANYSYIGFDYGYGCLSGTLDFADDSWCYVDVVITFTPVNPFEQLGE